MNRTSKRTRIITLADYIRQHSPLDAGLIVKDEDKPLATYNKVFEKIYIGNYQAAKDRLFFKEHDIKAVLNCTCDVPNHFAHKRDIEYMRIPVEDERQERDYEMMFTYMPCIVEFIHKHADIQQHNILVHCLAGRQRSCISVAAYLVAKHNMTPHEACKLVLDKRPEAFHFGRSLHFDQALNRYSTKLKKSCRRVST